MKNQNEEILNEFKEMMMDMSSTKKGQSEIATSALEVCNVLWFLHDPKGIIMKEAEKIFDIPDSGLNRSESDRLYKEYEILAHVHKHSITILNKSLKGKEFEKQVGYLINKIKALPERWQDIIVEQIKEYMDSGHAKKKNHSTEVVQTMAKVSKTMNGVVKNEILQYKYKDLLN